MKKETLQSLKPIYPIHVQKYNEFIPRPENENFISKLNSVIDYLTRIGSLNNQTVKQWNEVMKWITEEGLENITEEEVVKQFESYKEEADSISGELGGLKSDVEQAKEVSKEAKQIGYTIKVNGDYAKSQGDYARGQAIKSEEQYNRLKDTDVGTLSAQLEGKANNTINQVDYVSELQKLTSTKPKMNVKLGNANTKAFNVISQISPTKGLTYEFSKNANDDYILALGGYIGDLSKSKSISEMKNPSTMNGTFDRNFPPAIYTSTVGDYIADEFTGTKIGFYTFNDNRGGLWKFILDEGLSTQQTINVSVYSNTSGFKEHVIFDNLDKKKYTIKGVFQGQDPNNPVSSPRGWLYQGELRAQDTLRTFNIYNEAFENAKGVQALYSYSNKDFAIELRPAGSSEPYQFIPEHNAIGTAFKVEEPKVFADGKEITSWKDGSYILEVETVQLVQKVRGFHPSDRTNALVEVTTYQTIKDGVLSVTGKLKFLRDTDIKIGYTMMFPYWADFGTKIKTSLDNTYRIVTNQPNSKEYWSESDKSRSFIVVNDVSTDEKANIAVAMTVDNFEKTMRYGKQGRGNPFSWIEHRSPAMGKIYHAQFQNTVIPSGYEYRFGGRYTVALVNGVNGFVL